MERPLENSSIQLTVLQVRKKEAMAYFHVHIANCSSVSCASLSFFCSTASYCEGESGLFIERKMHWRELSGIKEQ